MMRFLTFISPSIFLACGGKDTQSFTEFQSDYFGARQGEELEDACGAWYEDCVAAGYSEEDCGTRLEYCDDGEWVSGNREDDTTTREEREDREEREEADCEDVATRAYEDCVDAGYSEEDCRERAAQAQENCEERT